MDVLNIISDNITVFIILVIILIINFCCILFLILKEKKEDKQEIKELLEELKPKEDFNVEKEQEQDKKLEQNKKEVEEMLIKMQKELEAKPEDAVSTFENEQEEKSIISYQELLDSVKNNNEVKVTPVKIETEKIEIEEIPDQEEKIDIDDMEDTVRIETVSSNNNQKKFKGTDFISPIFGRQENNGKYPSVPKRITRMDKLEVEKDEKYDKIDKSNLIDTKKLDDDLRKSDDFLKALKEFRKSLD